MNEHETRQSATVTSGARSGAKRGARRVRASVYRYFDRYGILLYVGVTARGPGRQRGHQASAPWWPLVVTARYEHFASVVAALEAERRAIEDELPVWNKMHRPVRYPYFEDAAEALNALPPGPYTIEQLAAATGIRADVLGDELADVRCVGVHRRRYGRIAVADRLSTILPWRVP